MNLENALLWFVAVIVSLTFHEAAHALFAKLGGDLTAYHGGQVTLNPIPHMRREPFGMVVLPILSLLLSNGQSCMGFAHAPFDPAWAQRHPKRAALMAAAGPLSNLLLAAVAFAVLWAIGRPSGNEAEAIRRIAGTFLMLNLLLFLLNLFPLPPLDGHSVVQGLLPRTRAFYDRLAAIPSFGLVVLILAIYLLPEVFWPVFFEVTTWLPHPYFPGR